MVVLQNINNKIKLHTNSRQNMITGFNLNILNLQMEFGIWNN